MSKRAEEAAAKAYPEDIEYEDWGGGRDINLDLRIGYQEGFEQAEKDLALTWEDIKMIFTIADNYDSEFNRPHIGSDAYYKEVLRRFNEQREK